jgi:hypothetical protein
MTTTIERIQVMTRGGETFDVELRPGHVPTGPHSDGPMGVLTVTTDGKGWRDALRQAAANHLGTTYGRVFQVVTTHGMTPDMVYQRRTWWLKVGERNRRS